MMGPVLVLAACGGNTGTQTDRQVDQVAIVVRNDLDMFNPYKSQLGSGSRQVFDGLYETLVREGDTSSGGDLQPALAQAWKATASSAVFTLKQGVECADGTPLTASGVAEALRYFADPKTGATFASSVFGPEGVRAIEADDAKRELSITLNAPYSEMLNGLAAYGYVVCPGALKDLDALDNAPAETGPYELSDHRRGDFYLLTRREGATATPVEPLAREVRVQISTEDSTRANMFDTHAVDIAMILGRDAERLAKKYTSIEGRAYEGYGILFNHAKGRAGADRDVRRALSMAVDASAYAKSATFGLGTAIDTLYTPNVDCYSEANGDVTPQFDPAAAKDVLKRVADRRGAALKVRLVADDSQNAGPEYVADAWRKAGADVELREGTFGQLVDIVYGTGDWDAVIYPTHTVTRSASSQLDVFTDLFSHAPRPEHVANPDFDAAVAVAVKADGSERCKAWQASEAALLRDGDVKPLMWPAVAWFSRDLTFTGSYTMVDLRSIRATSGA